VFFALLLWGHHPLARKLLDNLVPVESTETIVEAIRVESPKPVVVADYAGCPAHPVS